VSTNPIPLDQIKQHNDEFIRHLPEGLMKEELKAQAGEDPHRAFDALVSYYAGDETTRADIRGLFYALATGESWNNKKDGPTSGELAEQAGQIAVPPLPEELVKLCREKLMTLVQEHSKAPDLSEGEFEEYLDDLGILGSKPEDQQ